MFPANLPLGGHTYVDAVGAVMIFGVVFGLSIDYAVFLLSRMRERYDSDGDHAAAIEFGLEKTARVITGAAAIMMAVFIAFAGGADRDGEPARNRSYRRGAARCHRGADRLAAGADAVGRRAGLVVAAALGARPAAAQRLSSGPPTSSSEGGSRSPDAIIAPPDRNSAR